MILKTMDFQSKRVAIELTHPTGVSWPVHLGEFIAACKKAGYTAVDIVASERIDAENLLTLKKFEIDAVTVALESDPARLDPGRSEEPHGVDFELRMEPGPETDGAARPHYLLRISDVSCGLSFISDFAMLCGAAAALTNRALTRFHLTLYELAANTIEHAVFECEHPTIAVEMVPDEHGVEVLYRDNANAFPTAERRSVDIAEKVRGREKRGLGLYLLGQVADGLSFARKSGWNCTSFRVNLREAQTKRREKMVDFTLEIVPVALEGLILLKPKGHIDSESTPVLEKHFDSAVSAGKTRIVLDLSAADFISSSGVGLLLGSRGMLRQSGGDLILLNPSQQIKTVLEIAGVDDYFRIVSSIDEIASSLSA